MRRHLAPILALLVLAAFPAAAHTKTALLHNGALPSSLATEPEIALPAIVTEAEDRLEIFVVNRKLASGIFCFVVEPNIWETHELGGKSWQGHDYMHARYFNPNFARFLSVDPYLDAESALSQPQRWNRYGYAVNNPINKVDPDGRDAIAYKHKNGDITVTIPVHFTGQDATPSNIKAILAKDNSIKITGKSNIKLVVVSANKPIDGVLNTLDLSPGPDTAMCGKPGECINRMGGDQGHINTANGLSNDAAAHDVLHFAGIQDQYKEGPPDQQGNRTAVPTPGYTNSNVMTSRSGTELKPKQLEEAVKNPSTKKIRDIK